MSTIVITCIVFRIIWEIFFITLKDELDDYEYRDYIHPAIIMLYSLISNGLPLYFFL